METHKKIEVNPEIMFGKPVIKGTKTIIATTTKHEKPQRSRCLAISH